MVFSMVHVTEPPCLGVPLLKLSAAAVPEIDVLELPLPLPPLDPLHAASTARPVAPASATTSRRPPRGRLSLPDMRAPSQHRRQPFHGSSHPTTSHKLGRSAWRRAAGGPNE